MNPVVGDAVERGTDPEASQGVGGGAHLGEQDAARQQSASSRLQLSATVEVDVSELIGRTEVELDHEAIGLNLKGKKVLVTGAGGSIGSEICRQVHAFQPAALYMLDRDEGGLHAVELSIKGEALFRDGDVVLADIRDAQTLTELFCALKPDVVFHAAALKHLALLEQYPTEAVYTNVVGTYNVLQAAAACGASQVVNVSTDKAANPSSVLGTSKRCGERLTAYMAEHHEGLWVSVRFGNVFGSRGSVLSTFQQQIETGGPVTVTDPNVERYFMTIPEASRLVLQAATVGRTGETLVLEMGEPVKIAELARRLIELNRNNGTAAEGVGIEFTGLREGEKMSEELVDERETPLVGDRHPMVTEVTVDKWEYEPERIEAALRCPNVAHEFLVAVGG